MTPEYQFYHGALLHEIVLSAGCEIRIMLRDFHGRPDAFVINGKIGLLIKHSSARLTPWLFTFAKENVAELLSLRAETKVCFIGLVCDEDGFVCVRDSQLIGILMPGPSELVSVRVDRRPRRMYRVSSSGNSIDGKLAKGVHDIVAEIRRLSDKRAFASFRI
jgi:hypothetical protein